MGLDVGSKTVGVAVSDGLGWTAQGIETVKINEEQNQYGFKRIGELLKEYEVTKVVVGIPKNMNGTIGPRGEASQFYGNELNKRFGVEVIYWDERLTTIVAERVLLDADVSRKKGKK